MVVVRLSTSGYCCIVCAHQLAIASRVRVRCVIFPVCASPWRRIVTVVTRIPFLLLRPSFICSSKKRKPTKRKKEIKKGKNREKKRNEKSILFSSYGVCVCVCG